MTTPAAPPPDPTPEELVDQLAKHHGKSPVKYDRVLKRVIRDAERLGHAHQVAVSKFMAQLAGVPAAKAAGTTWTHHPFYDDVTLEIYLKIDDRMFVSRERVSFDVWDIHFKRDSVQWESFLNHFCRQAVGGMSQDPEQFAYLRRKLFVVTPEDRHDSRLCRASNDSGLNKDLWPKCLSGVVRKALPRYRGLFETGLSDSPIRWDTSVYTDTRPLGRCMCRCHKHPLNQLDPEYHIGYLNPYDDRGFFI